MAQATWVLVIKLPLCCAKEQFLKVATLWQVNPALTSFHRTKNQWYIVNCFLHNIKFITISIFNDCRIWTYPKFLYSSLSVYNTTHINQQNHRNFLCNIFYISTHIQRKNLAHPEDTQTRRNKKKKRWKHLCTITIKTN